MEPIFIPYRKNVLWGYCTYDKNIILECIYDGAYPFDDDLAIIKMNGKSGCWIKMYMPSSLLFNIIFPLFRKDCPG